MRTPFLDDDGDAKMRDNNDKEQEEKTKPEDSGGISWLLIVLGLVAAVLIVAAVLGTFVLGLGDNVQENPTSGGLGYTTGGAQDTNNFRDNVREDYLPLPTDITYEGLFHGYYFDTGGNGYCADTFCPSYSTAVTEHPLTNETERYMTVGLDSNMDAEEFERKKLNLVVVLDKSGSMDSRFDEYYYDRYGNRHEVETEGRSKMDVAKDAVGSVAERLNEDDRLGVVSFDSDARVERRLRPVGDTERAKSAVRRIRADGSTSLSDGMDEATAMLREFENADPTEYENRVVFVTDAMPNTDETRRTGLLRRIEENADSGVHTTFVGVGVDYNTELVEGITSVRGANYFSVHSAEEFEERMEDGFEYAVTPLIYDLSVEVDGAEVERVYGTDAEGSTEEVMRTKTLFPSPQEDGETKGGVVLVKLEDDAEDARLRATWEERGGWRGSSERRISFIDEGFENDGVRKAVLLARYGRLMKDWTRHEWTEARGENIDDGLGRWERRSEELVVSEEYRDRIDEFVEHFEGEVDALNDDDISKETEVMEEILSAPAPR
ncbi:MAG: VWA domain-containing protein [Halobacteriales archaeon]|nr:VWA domain-containing protein [Halobacteriales archaeon]